ncbi:MAG: AAA family ATPase [Campylobacterota bacterium]|nr:AAA family ATPase [Campylobacterota bacterium]
METKNLMEINSPNIGTANSIYGFQKLHINNLIGEKLKSGIAKQMKYEYINLQFESIDEVHEVLEEHFNFFKVNGYDGYIIEDDFIADFAWEYESNNVGFTIQVLAKTLKACDSCIYKIKQVLSKFVLQKTLTTFEVIQYINNETLSNVVYKDSIDVDFNSLAIPFIEDTNKYIDSFLNSKAPILILQGAPGTGKSTFTKQILKKMQQIKDKESLNVIYSFDEAVFHTTKFFSKIVYHDYDVLVLEDFNTSIHKNQDDQGANPLNKFLSITDGLISKYKKIIITTNIESKNQLQQALIRPGRCFDIVQFRNLEGVEIDDLCDSCARDLDLQIESISASEFYAKCNGEQNSSIVNSKVGF